MDEEVETKELPEIDKKEMIFGNLWGRKPIHKTSKIVWPKENHAMETV